MCITWVINIRISQLSEQAVFTVSKENERRANEKLNNKNKRTENKTNSRT